MSDLTKLKYLSIKIKCLNSFNNIQYLPPNIEYFEFDCNNINEIEYSEYYNNFINNFNGIIVLGGKLIDN